MSAMAGPPRTLPHLSRPKERTCLCVFALALIVAGLPAAAQNDFKSLMQQAFALHQRGDYTSALPLLRRASAIEPEDYFVNLLLGIDTLRSGDPPGSIPFLKRASQIKPKEEFPFAYLGEAYARQRLYADASHAYLKATEVAAGSADAAVSFVDFSLSRFADLSTDLRSSTKGLAAEYRLQARALPEGDASRIPLLQRSADLDPSAPGIWSELGRAALAAGDTTSASEDCKKALAADAHDLDAATLEAELAARASDWKKVNERLNAVAQRSPEMLSQEAIRWPKTFQPPPGTTSGAAARFFSCVAAETKSCQFTPVAASGLTPSSLFQQQRWGQLAHLPALPSAQATAWKQRGIAFAHLMRCGEAIPALERALAGTASDAYAEFELSWCYSQEAGRTAEHVAESAEDEAALHLMRGDIFLRLQAKPELAIGEYQRALSQNPNDPSVLDRLAEAQFGAGQSELATENAKAALRIDPQRLGPTRTLAKIAMQDRDYATALPYLEKLAARNPNDITGRIELGKACAQTGKLEEARQNLEPALQNGYPDEKGTLHFLLGNVLKKLGQSAEADKAFAAATELSDAFQKKSYRDQDPDAQR